MRVFLRLHLRLYTDIILTQTCHCMILTTLVEHQADFHRGWLESSGCRDRRL